MLVWATLLVLLSIPRVKSEPCSLNSATKWCLFTSWLPTNTSHCDRIGCRNQTFLPSVGNGYLATVAMSDEMHVSGIYNGAANVHPGRGGSVVYHDQTHRARIPSYIAVNFSVPDEQGFRTYALDTYDGCFHQWFRSYKHGISIHQRVYAHRQLRHIAVNEIHISTSREFVLELTSNSGNSSTDINFTDENNFESLGHEVCGQVNQPEYFNGPRPTVCMVSTVVPAQVRMSASNSTQSFYFVVSIATSLDKYQLPLQHVAVQLWKQAQAMAWKGELFDYHRQAWNSLWKDGSIDILGDLSLAQTTLSSIYYLLSSSRPEWKYGINPGGLSGGEEYFGHVFWDQDTWMYPAILTFFPDFARALLEYRYDRLETAKEIAKKNGWNGAMYPWESALSGIEVSPGDVYGKHEIHISGDVAFAVEQYWLATGDVTWMNRVGWPIVESVAEFWVSRVLWNATKERYVIIDVMPPDEYQYPVNNSYFTNVVAVRNLRFANWIAKHLNRSTPSIWKDVELKLFVPYDPVLDYHPEFEGFNISANGTSVKQADVILAGFPLMSPMSASSRKNDLLYYLHVTDPAGPAMTHFMFAIGFLEIGLHDEAEREFQRYRENLQEPFKVWSEEPDGSGASNFLTAAGGFLQSLLFGYGGLRLQEDGLHFDLGVVAGTDGFVLDGIKYHFCSLKFSVNQNSSSIELLEQAGPHKDVYVSHDGSVDILSIGRPIYFVKPKGLVTLV